MALLNVELGNFRLAINHCVRIQDSGLLSGFFDSLARIFMDANLIGDFEQLAEETIRVSRLEISLYIEASALGLKGQCTASRGEDAQAEKSWNEGFESSKHWAIMLHAPKPVWIFL
jgi:hypothetical protein